MTKKPEEKEAPLNEEELDQVAGGANPFEDKKRVKEHDYDEDIKEKI